jgi:hypothetical protein
MRSKIDEIKSLDARIDALKGMRKVLLDEWAKESCPYKVGDIVTVCGYSHKGKRCKVTDVGWSQDWCGKYKWTVRGVVVLKNGELGKLTADWNQDHERKYKQ